MLVVEPSLNNGACVCALNHSILLMYLYGWLCKRTNAPGHLYHISLQAYSYEIIKLFFPFAFEMQMFGGEGGMECVTRLTTLLP